MFLCRGTYLSKIFSDFLNYSEMLTIIAGRSGALMSKYLFLIFLIAARLNGNEMKIFSSPDIQRLESEVEGLDGEVLVMLDVDSTLVVADDAILRPKGDSLLDRLLGGDKVLKVSGGSRYLFREILLKAPHSLVDARSQEVIQRLRERNVHVIAFTGVPRGKIGDVENVGAWRIEELTRFGFDFKDAFSEVGTIELAKDPDQEFSPIFTQGILFSSLHSKGKVLRSFFEKVGYQPKWMVLVDDQMEHVQSVGKVAEDLGINYVGFHYTAAEELPSILDPDRAAFQVKHFIDHGEWKTDLEI